MVRAILDGSKTQTRRVAWVWVVEFKRVAAELRKEALVESETFPKAPTVGVQEEAEQHRDSHQCVPRPHHQKHDTAGSNRGGMNDRIE